MLFNSVLFIVIFLPLCLIGYYLLQRLDNPNFAKCFLIGMSMWFYGYYNPYYLWILIGSILANYGCSLLFERRRKPRQDKWF